MKHTMKRALALVMALMLAIPVIVMAEDDAGLSIQLGTDVALEDQDNLLLDGLTLDEGLSLEESDLPVEAMPTGEEAVEATTSEPTEEPAGEPTEQPAEEPTEEPAGEPADAPAGEPAVEPTDAPTATEPEAEPTDGQQPSIESEDIASEPTETPEEPTEVEVEGALDEGVDAATEAPAEAIAEEAAAEDAPAQAEPFEQSATVDGVVITVSAPAGAFPAGAVLSVKRATAREAKRADAAIDAARDEEQTVVASYTFDISVLDGEGNELQPAEGFEVQVSFAMAEVADEGLNVDVYHMSEAGKALTAEALDVVDVDGDTVTAQTDGFSLYTVQFTESNAEQAVSVKYFNPATNKMETHDCMPLKNVNEKQDHILGDGWYAVTSDVTFNAGMIIYGTDTNLVLCDGKTLTAKDGIWVQPGKKLTIWGQKGKLDRLIATGGENKAGIGGIRGMENHKVATIVINGGTIEATGGEYAAGIGTGFKNAGYDHCYDITINGGTVTATGGSAGAGIGGGGRGRGGNVTINGGVVKAFGGYRGAGIGGGDQGSAREDVVTITGGIVTAKGGEQGAGIGGGCNYHGGTVKISGGHVTAIGGVNAAGIGGGDDGLGGNVTITGGTVVAQGQKNSDGKKTDYSAVAIGRGCGGDKMGTLNIIGRLKVQGSDTPDVYDRTFKAGERVSACQSLLDVFIHPCDHPKADRIYKPRDENLHDVTCTCCDGALSPENHTFVDSLKYGAKPYCKLCKQTWVRYVDADGKDKGYHPAIEMKDDSTSLKDGWYTVYDDTTINVGRKIVTDGEVNLILCDGAKLNAKAGINVRSGKLTIWCDRKGTGVLNATATGENAGIRVPIGPMLYINGGVITARGSKGGAGIGGDVDETSGYIEINGGKVVAWGGFRDDDDETREDRSGAGIGGGNKAGSGAITINGGTVEAYGGSSISGRNVIGRGAGIGGGYEGNCGNVTINGGKVTARGGGYNTGGGAGIGGGYGRPKGGNLNGTVTITGGDVTAVSGAFSAGIGGGYCGNADDGKVKISGGKVTAIGGEGGAGIGGGDEEVGTGGNGADVSITGGTVIVQSGKGKSCAIGNGDGSKKKGKLSFGDNMMVQAGNDGDKYERTFTVGERVNACQSRYCARIEACDHHDTGYEIKPKTHQRKTCQWCGRKWEAEAHTFDKNFKCTVCGYERENHWVTFDANGGKGKMEKQKIFADKPESLRINAFTWEGHTFKGWNTKKDGSGTAYANMAKIDLKQDTTLYAQWYTHVTIIGRSLTAAWDGKPKSVGGYNCKLWDGRWITVTFPGVYAHRSETEIGVYPVKVMGAKVNETISPNGNYIVTNIVDGQLAIVKGDPDYQKPRAKALTYNGKEQTLIEPGTTTGGQMRYSLDRRKWSTDLPTGKDAGEYTVWFRVFGDEHYDTTQALSLTVTIAKAKLTVTADMQVKYYGDPDPKLTYKVSGQLYGDDKLTGELTRSKGEEVGGIYAIRIGTLTAGKNYDIDFIQGYLAIVRSPQPIVPIPTAKPTAKPTVTAKPKPTIKPIVTARPKPTAKQTQKPTKAPKPTVKPYRPEGELPVVTVKPTVKPKPTTKPTTKPTAKPTEKPQSDQSDFTLFARLKASGSDGTVLELSWTKVEGADGYDIYFAKGNDAQVEFYKSVSGSPTRFEITGLEKRVAYKACVQAWKRKKGETTVIGRESPLVYAITGGYDDNWCNPQSVKLEKKNVTLKVGASYGISATVKGAKAGRQVLNLQNNLRYYSSDRSVATVTDTGEIKAVGAGSCKVYVMAINGIRVGVKVTVK